MGDGNAIAKASRAQFFPGNQAFIDVLRFQVGHFATDQVGNLFKDAFFTASRHVHE
ncbi:hypothetical protein D9M71_817740 [compost metagenome]